MAHDQTFSRNSVYVAGGTVVALLTILIPIYKEVLLPNQLASANFEIEELRRQLKARSSELEEAKANIEKEKELSQKKDIEKKEELHELKAKSEQIEADLKKANAEILEIKMGNLFIEGSSYPATLDDIKVGQNIEIVESLFPNEEIEKSEYNDYWNVEIEHPFFKRITFYFDNRTSLIYQILYSADFIRTEESASEKFLQKHLEKRFGTPIKISEKHFMWKANERLTIFKDDDYSLIISATGVIPGSWIAPLTKFKEKSMKEEKTDASLEGQASK